MSQQINHYTGPRYFVKCVCNCVHCRCLNLCWHSTCMQSWFAWPE